jgi:nitroreductase
MWDFFATVRHRHSVRHFIQDRAVEPEKIHAILEMACAAPSAGDLQAYQIHVLQAATRRAQLANAAFDQTFIAQAPLSLVFSADPQRSASRYAERGAALYALQDATIAATYAQLAIVAAGLGSTWIGQFDEERVRHVIESAPELRPVAILAVGYPAEFPEPTPRRKMSDIVKHLD